MTAPPRIYDQASFEVRFEWGLAGANVLAPVSEVLVVVVVVDVLSFPTAVEVALARGATVVPTGWSDQRAATLAAEHGAILPVGRSQTTPAAPYSLSPASLADLPAGACLVLPSPNGAALISAAAQLGPLVLTGCLRNAGAVARAADAGRHDHRHRRWRALARRQSAAGVGGSPRRGRHPRPSGRTHALPRSPGRCRRCPDPGPSNTAPTLRVRTRTDHRRPRARCADRSRARPQPCRAPAAPQHLHRLRKGAASYQLSSPGRYGPPIHKP